MTQQNRPDRRLTIGIIGNGSLDSDLDADKARIARDLGECLIDAGFRIVCGGKGGVMEAACAGARASDVYREGDTIGILSGGRADRANPFVDIVVPTSLGHARNGVVAQSDAVVAVGGGAGTLSEMCFAWIHDRLIVGLRVEGWSGRLADERIDQRRRFAHIDDDCVWGADTAEDVVARLQEQLPRYRRG